MDSQSPEPDWARVEALLDEALELPSDQRRAWLERVARDDPTLHERVEQLLSADAAAGDFLHDDAEAWLRSRQVAQAFTQEGALVVGSRVGPYRVVH